MFDAFITEIYSAKEVQDLQMLGPRKPSAAIIFGMKETDKFEETGVKVKDINAPRGLNLRFYEKRDLDEDVAIVKRIINAYANNEYVPLIALDNDMKIMDGLHRYVAALDYFGKNATIRVLKKK